MQLLLLDMTWLSKMHTPGARVLIRSSAIASHAMHSIVAVAKLAFAVNAVDGYARNAMATKKKIDCLFIRSTHRIVMQRLSLVVVLCSVQNICFVTY